MLVLLCGFASGIYTDLDGSICDDITGICVGGLASYCGIPVERALESSTSLFSLKWTDLASPRFCCDIASGLLAPATPGDSFAAGYGDV